MEEIVLYLLICLAAISKATRDILLHDKYNRSVFSLIPKSSKLHYFFNTPREMSRNKYKDRDDVARKERFPLSTSVFVWLLDGFHFTEFLIRLSMFGVMVASYWMEVDLSPIKIIAFWVLHSMVFRLFYRRVLIKTNE